MVFPVVMYGCKSWTIKKAEHQRIDAFELWCWRRLFRVPWTARRSNQSILKDISPEYSLKGLMLKLKLQHLHTWCGELTHLKRSWYSERLRVGGKVDDRGWDCWMASPTQWSWVWVSSGSWWWTGKPGVLHSMGSQRVGHDWVAELTDNIYTFHLQNVVFLLLYTRQHFHHQKCVSLTTMLLIPFSHSCLPTASSSPVITPTLFSVSMRLFYLVWFAHLFCWLFVFLYCMYDWNQIVFVFTCVLSSFLVSLWDYFYYLEKGMANHFSILALRTPWTVWKGYSP